MVRMEHGEKQGLNADGNWPKVITGKAVVVESALVPQELTSFFGQAVERPIKVSSWISAIYYPDGTLWNYLKQTPHGISWAGFAAKVTR